MRVSGFWQVSEILNEMPSDGLGLLHLTASASASIGSSSSSFEKREEYLNLHDKEIFIWTMTRGFQPEKEKDKEKPGRASLWTLWRARRRTSARIIFRNQAASLVRGICRESRTSCRTQPDEACANERWAISPLMKCMLQR